jgi:hypothetical protein
MHLRSTASCSATARQLRSADDDQVTIVACGVTVDEAEQAADVLAADGVRARVVDCYSIKPIDATALRNAAHRTGALVTVEDHWPEGGLGDAVLDALAEFTEPGATAATRAPCWAVTVADLRGEPGEGDAEVGVGGGAVGEELVGDVGGGGGGDGDAEGDRAGARGEVGLVDADDAAGGVEQRAAGVAGGDGGVDLDEVDQRAALGGGAGDLAVDSGDDAGGDGVLQAQRAVDGEHGFAGVGQVGAVLGHGSPVRVVWMTAMSAMVSVARTVPEEEGPSA